MGERLSKETIRDKQNLAMASFHRLLLFLCFSPLILTFTCPHGSDQMPKEDKCIYTVAESKFYLNAYKYCVRLVGIPAKIENIFDNSYAFAMIDEGLNGVAPYIGVEKTENNTWTYADGTPLKYQNWGLNEPNTLSNGTICTILDPQTGKWMAVECTLSRPFFCTINGDDFQCSDGWVYNGQTDYCYFLQNFTYTDSVHWQLYNWTNAEENCQRMNSHLVSIHSTAEENFIYDLVTANVANLTSDVPDGHPCWYQWSWIGLYGDGSTKNSTWSDGSYFENRGQEIAAGDQYWLISNDPSCDYHRWVYSRSPANARYVCKKASKRRIEREWQQK